MVEGIDGRVAIVTGAGRGIGQGVAVRLAREGARVVLNDRDQEPLNETLKLIEEAGGTAVGLAASVTDSEIGQRLAELAVNTYGDVHIVVTAAGFLWDGMIHRMTDEQFETIVDVHLGGTFRVVRDTFKVMREHARDEKERGENVPARRIVTISSLSGFGNLGQANYAAAKAGLEGFSRSLAQEIASRNITVNCIAPGFIQTDMTDVLPEAQKEAILASIPGKRFGNVDDIAGAVAFLASDDARYITGQTLHVNGGMNMG